MPLELWRQAWSYQILSPIGPVGEVYKATDTRLDRLVASKILPVHLSSDPLLRERFEREARLVSSLNQPHISTHHDIGHEEGTDFLVIGVHRKREARAEFEERRSDSVDTPRLNRR